MKAVFVILWILTCACGGHSSLEVYVESGQEEEKNSAEGNSANMFALKSDPVTAEGIGSYAQQTDEFNQSQKGLLDILLVIDNSGSMGSHQGKVAANLDALLQYIRASNWQIAVIGTKLSSCLSERITKNTPKVQSKYRQLVNLGAMGNGEYYFYKAIHGLKGECNGTVSPWLRDGSTVAVLIVGDQFNECHERNDGGDHSGEALPPDGLCRSSDLVAHLQALRPRGKAKLYGIVYLQPGNGYAFNYYNPEALNIFHAYGSISDKNYNNTLQTISQNVQTALENVFILSQVPFGEIEVKVDGQALTSAQYTIDAENKQLRFDRSYVPPENAALAISYTYLVE